jgi:predicted dehydrogenase
LDLENNKDVFIEKPITSTIEEARDLGELCR